MRSTTGHVVISNQGLSLSVAAASDHCSLWTLAEGYWSFGSPNGLRLSTGSLTPRRQRHWRPNVRAPGASAIDSSERGAMATRRTSGGGVGSGVRHSASPFGLGGDRQRRVDAEVAVSARSTTCTLVGVDLVRVRRRVARVAIGQPPMKCAVIGMSSDRPRCHRHAVDVVGELGGRVFAHRIQSDWAPVALTESADSARRTVIELSATASPAG